MVLSGLIAANDGRSVQGDGASNLEPGSILAGFNEVGCLTHIRTVFVRMCIRKLIVRVSVLGVSCKVITLSIIEPR